MGIILLVVLLILLFGAFPRGGAYNEGWGYGPTGLVGLLLVVLLILVVLGYVPHGF